MTTYTRRGPGQTYLKDVLAERINSLIEHKDLNLEVNPLKVYEQMINQIEEDTGSLPANLPKGVAPEVAQENADVQAIIAPRLTMLMEIANTFLSTIIDSIDSVPYGIRWICKQIRSLTKRKYPDATDFAICSLIGVHARRRTTCQASSSYADLDCKDAAEPGKQAELRKGAVHAVLEPVCGEQQDEDQPVLECTL
jgi:hypothetical protein